ncbi:MAG TPA: sulfatase-like hydrolase/transferase [Planctomycetota bacterium]|nr:sulfatase-like hydrolase/transferase [Planctomycetota bacterium]
MADARPNILWICTDQQRWDTVGALGNPHIRTPHVDRLVREGVAFTRCYSQSPICTPSRANFLTGYYPSTLHVNRNGNDFFPCPEKLITRRLADKGYDCGLSGKLHLAAANGRVEPRFGDGYRVYQWSHHPYPEKFWPHTHHAYQAWLAERGVDWAKAYGQRGGLFRTGIEAKYHQTTWCANEAIAFLCEKRTGPWLFSFNCFDPHPPFDPPPEYMARMNVAAMPLPLFQPHEMESQLAFGKVDHQTRKPVSPHDYDARRMVAAYYAQIELIDDQVGRMLDALEAAGQRDNTIVIFTSDHGEMLGDHGLQQKGCRFYEGAVRVPLVLSWSGRVKAGLRSDALVELTDLPVTLMQATGLDVPADTHGKSLLPILEGKADPARHRDFVRCEYHDAIPFKDGDASHANMIVDGRHKLVVYHGHDAGELYDLRDDPREFRNLWDDAGSRDVKLALLKRLFDATMLATDPGQPRVGNY